MFAPSIFFHLLRRGFLPVRDRHVYTRSGRLRLRYVSVVAVAFMGLAGSNLSYHAPDGFMVAQAQAGIADMPAAILASAAVPPHSSAVAALPVAPAAPVKPAVPLPANFTRTFRVAAGDTLSNLVENASITGDQAADVIRALKQQIDPRSLKVGQAVTVHYSRAGDGAEQWTGMDFAPTPLTRVVLRQGAGGALKVEKQEIPLTGETRAARARISTSIYGDLHRAGVPDSIIAQFIKLYSYSIDFARDIWDGDSVDLLYSVSRSEDGRFVKGEDLLYASLTVRGKPNVIVRFSHNGQPEFYDGHGAPIKKALLRTPVDGARVTSGFGMRRHPIQGYTKMHKGVDFGAPTGTPIFAAGDGVVGRAGWFGGYGNYVTVRHNGTYSTAYGHMSKILVKPGQRVRQGQVIGRVGTTGNSTGPHLHFEVIQNGAAINPIKVANLSVGEKLGGRQMARFQQALAAAKDSIQAITAGGAKPMLVSMDSSR